MPIPIEEVSESIAKGNFRKSSTAVTLVPCRSGFLFSWSNDANGMIAKTGEMLVEIITFSQLNSMYCIVNFNGTCKSFVTQNC